MKVTCSKCGAQYDAPVHQSINVGINPEMKQKVMSGELFVATCPACGERKLLAYPLIYQDPSQHLLICLSPEPISAEGFEGTARRVTDVGSLIEKVKIFDAGLDDLALELAKYVTRQEMGKSDVKLKFLRLEGADNEMILTYPENGAMQMIAIGFNVYEDCRGIVQRNPAMAQSARGLALIDEGWVAEFIG